MDEKFFLKTVCYVVFPAVLLVLLLMSKLFFPLLLWIPTMNVTSFLFGWGPISWKEEVLLHDGSSIVVKRSQTHGGFGEIGQSPIKYQKISFTVPGSGKRVIWEDEYTDDIGHTNFDAVALHISDKTPYLILNPDKCLSYNKWGRPNPPYILLKYESDTWQQIEMSDLPQEFENINLTITTSGDEKKLVNRWVVPAEMVKELNRLLQQDYLQTIIREPLKPGSLGVSCNELIHTENNHWLSLDWFSGQSTYQDCLKVCIREEVLPQKCPCLRFFRISK